MPDYAEMWPSHYSLLAAISSDFRLFNVGNDGCSCSLYKLHNEINEKTLKRKFKKKGWKSGRIRQAIDELKEREQQEQGVDKNIREWIASIAEHDGKALIMVHWDADELPRVADSEVIDSWRVRSVSSSIVAEKIFIINGNPNRLPGTE